MDQARIDEIKEALTLIEGYIGESEPPSIITDCKDMIDDIEIREADMQVKATEYDLLNSTCYTQNNAIRDLDVEVKQLRDALGIWALYVAAREDTGDVPLLNASEKFIEGKQALIDLGFLNE